MSVQNGERLATKQDLADMYQAMLPYLGGLPEVVANKFSKGDLYSTDEKMIGQWVDGKPLYQKTIQTSMPSSGDTQIDTTDLSIQHIIDVSGISIGVTFEGFVPTPINGGKACFCFVNPTQNKLYLYNDYNDYGGRTVYLTIKYTKTTDTAISIGNDTDYSTDEKIVGTWVDGKPLYQKTFTATSPTSQESVTNIVDISSLNANMIMVKDGYVCDQQGAWRPLNCSFYESNRQNGSGVWIRYDKEHIAMCVNDMDLLDTSVVVTLQYTKTN